MKDREYKAGDTVYWINFPLVIRCKITRVDDYFRKQHPAAYLFYEIDEPVGHSLPVEDLYDSFEDAKSALIDDYYGNLDALTCLNEPGLSQAGFQEIVNEFIHKHKTTTLDSRRQRTIDFIKSTWLPGGMTQEEYDEASRWFEGNPYPLKIHITDWFNVFDLLD